MIDEFNIDFLITGIGEINKSNNISLYPNPATEVANLKIKNTFSGDVSISLLSSQGKLLLHQVVNGNNSEIIHRIDMTSNPRGVYLIRVENTHGITMLKVLKQ